jgi:hypothetical protein
MKLRLISTDVVCYRSALNMQETTKRFIYFLKYQKSLINRLIELTNQLMMDQYGNYVLQYIITLSDFKNNDIIANYFKYDIGHLSKQKFSSNVIEKVCYYN